MSRRPSIDARRLWSTVERQAEIGKGRPGGLCRPALSDADRQVRDLFASWCREAGLEVQVDRMGSMFARRNGRDDSLAPVLFGSHLDTQVNGGRFDGPMGVLAGLEVMRALDDAGIVTERPLVLVNWTNEEGARFSPPMVAAGVFAGASTLEWAHARPSDDGPTLGEELVRIGYAGERAVGFPIDSYFELHIEQGPILDAEKVPVGVVTHGYESFGYIVEIEGETAHTGPWPMEKRRNALMGAVRLAAAIDDLGQEHAATAGKATVARIVAAPNKPGILSDWAQITFDVRHDDPATAKAMAAAAEAAIPAAAAKANVTMKVLDRWHWGGKMFAPELIDLVRATARGLGHATRDLPSQAGHDAYYLARVAPTAMIFTPCKDGITHNNNEFTTLEAQLPGVETLLHAVLARANQR
jgi:N-carbamoyl-L-amino-acid hydrolase